MTRNLADVLQSAKRLIVLVVGTTVVLSCIAIGINEWQRMEPGQHCKLTKNVFGVADLEESYDQLRKAATINDSYGIADLISRDKAAYLLRGTEGLVLDGEYSFKGGGMYRKLRILADPYAEQAPPTLPRDFNFQLGSVDIGKAFWVRRDDLIELPFR